MNPAWTVPVDAYTHVVTSRKACTWVRSNPIEMRIDPRRPVPQPYFVRVPFEHGRPVSSRRASCAVRP